VGFPWEDTGWSREAADDTVVTGLFRYSDLTRENANLGCFRFQPIALPTNLNAICIIACMYPTVYPGESPCLFFHGSEHWSFGCFEHMSNGCLEAKPLLQDNPTVLGHILNFQL
jgi:hypothetical protein